MKNEKMTVSGFRLWYGVDVVQQLLHCCLVAALLLMIGDFCFLEERSNSDVFFRFSFSQNCPCLWYGFDVLGQKIVSSLAWLQFLRASQSVTGGWEERRGERGWLLGRRPDSLLITTVNFMVSEVKWLNNTLNNCKIQKTKRIIRIIDLFV